MIKNAQAGSSMFVGTSPAFDLAMFSTCFIRGNEGATNCDCQINAGGVVSNVQMKAVKRQGKVVTAYPRNVIRKIFIAIITNFLLQVLLKTQTTSTY